jgi:hypothetical protein
MKLKTRLSFHPMDCDLSLKLNAVPAETVRSLQTTAHLLTSKLGDMSVNTDVTANVAATDQFLMLKVKSPGRSEKKPDDVAPPSPISPLSPFPEGFVADSPVSRWDVWRRETGLRLCSTAVQTTPKPLLPKRSMMPIRFAEKVDAAVQTAADKVDAAVQTAADDAPLTLKHLRDELKAFAIAFGF